VKLPVDTSAIAFLCAMPPEPVVDFETKRPRADENGEPLYVVQLVALAENSAEILAVKVPGMPASASARATPSRSSAWSPSRGRWATAPASPSARLGSSRRSRRPRPASSRREPQHAREGPADRLLEAGPAPPPTRQGVRPPGHTHQEWSP
jgi:hypothetical protein